MYVCAFIFHAFYTVYSRWDNSQKCCAQKCDVSVWVIQNKLRFFPTTFSPVEKGRKKVEGKVKYEE